MKLMNLARLMAWALVATMPMWFASCKENGSGTDVVTPGGSSVQGSWKISGMKLSDGKDTEDYLELMKSFPGGADAVACLTDIKITFNANGKITSTTSPKCKSDDAAEYNPAEDNSTWKVNGNKLQITSSDGVETYDFTVDGSTMKWNIASEEDLDGDGVIDKFTTIIEFKRA